MGRYPEIDLSAVVPRPVEERVSLVGLEGLAQPVAATDAALLDRLPDLLGARALRRLVAATALAARDRRRVAFMAGGHVIKTGFGPFFNHLLARGIPGVISLNGSAAIHDFELATLVRTSVDVESGLDSVSFGMAEETTRRMNELTVEAARAGEGAWRGIGPIPGRTGPLRGSQRPGHRVAARHPVTVHVALGTDILHQHASADGAAMGHQPADFRILAAALRGFPAGSS